MSCCNACHHWSSEFSNYCTIWKYWGSSDKHLCYFVDEKTNAWQQCIGALNTVVTQSLYHFSTFEIGTTIWNNHSELLVLIFGFHKDHLKKMDTTKDQNSIFLCVRELRHCFLNYCLICPYNFVCDNRIKFLVDLLLLFGLWELSVYLSDWHL